MKIPAVNFDCAYRFNTSATDLKQVGCATPLRYIKGFGDSLRQIFSAIRFETTPLFIPSAIAFVREKSVDVARFKILPYHE